MIYLTGDIHGDLSKIERIKDKNLLTDKDYLIILGDFGFLWSNEYRKDYIAQIEVPKLNFINSCPWTTLTLDGNHENFSRLDNLPIQTKFGDEVGCIHDKIFHLKRGRVYTIEGMAFFTFGGATSIDKIYRIKDISWWEREISNADEENLAITNLENYKYDVDYVLTHTPPDKILNILIKNSSAKKIKCPVSKFLERIYKNTNFKNWYAGHMHEDGIIREDERVVMLYNELIPLGKVSLNESDIILPYIY